MAKGGSFENEVCEALSLWWTNNQRDDVFCRTRASGAKYTSRKKSGKDTVNQGGDITFSDSVGEPLIKKWSIECKTGYASKPSKTKTYSKGQKITKKVNLIENIKNSNLDENIKKTLLSAHKNNISRWDVLDIIDSRQEQTELEKMWNQCERDAKLTNREPVLIFRRNHREKCMMMRENKFGKFWIFNHFVYVKLSLSRENLVIFKLSDFVEFVDVNKFKD